ncbi:hypothetical protein GQ43DRAFT_289251 [Delitschia confertaspora ATCC 74209]|uniref:Acetyltransferase, GNAT family n=1 Tax=Delitschia confertaspora ATCC 74209 TaxID=1513339 RepID=A0A9P4MTX2_9PLEO|nr:hypothetical protein GQ43DRAFT_289251 [Delitschia confertaspora ATCC 74209]
MITQHPLYLSTPLSAHALDTAPPDCTRGSIVLRVATPSDLDALVNIALVAMPMDPQWDYRFPHRRSFPGDTLLFTRRRYREFLENKSGRWSVILAELVYRRSMPRNRKSYAQSIAFAVWDVAHISPGAPVASREAALPTCGIPSRRDASCKRLKAWKQTLSTSSRDLFDKQYGLRYFQLQILATHPRFHRIGAGTALCRQGIRAAEKLDMKIAVFASPMGKRLYGKLGFRKLATVKIQVEGEDESICIEAMSYEPNSWSRPLGEYPELPYLAGNYS